MARPFVINVGALRRSASPRREQRSGVLRDVAVTGSRLSEDVPVEVDLRLEMASGTSILATGTVTAGWEGDCARCLRPARGELRAEVRELFEDDHDPLETYPIRGDELDVEPLARDAVLLQLPQVPLCSEECQGLCPECGVPLDEGDCGHGAKPTDPRWAALDALHDDTTNE